jgi:hypothetical protein
MLARLTGLVFILATTFAAQAQDTTTLTDTAWYSMKYGVGLDKVHVEAKPEDCDYYTRLLATKDATTKGGRPLIMQKEFQWTVHG